MDTMKFFALFRKNVHSETHSQYFQNLPALLQSLLVMKA